MTDIISENKFQDKDDTAQSFEDCCANIRNVCYCGHYPSYCYHVACHDPPYSIMNILCCCACCGLDCGCIIDLLCGCSHDDGDEVHSTRTGMRLC